MYLFSVGLTHNKVFPSSQVWNKKNIRSSFTRVHTNTEKCREKLRSLRTLPTIGDLLGVAEKSLDHLEHSSGETMSYVKIRMAIMVNPHQR